MNQEDEDYFQPVMETGKHLAHEILTARDLNRPTNKQKSSTAAHDLLNTNPFFSFLLASSNAPSFWSKSRETVHVCVSMVFQSLWNTSSMYCNLLCRSHSSLLNPQWGLKAGRSFTSVSPSDHSSNSILSLEIVQHRVIKLNWSTWGSTIKDNMEFYERNSFRCQKAELSFFNRNQDSFSTYRDTRPMS